MKFWCKEEDIMSSEVEKNIDIMQIASQLDRLDNSSNKRDARIKASIWNSFIKDKGGKVRQKDISTYEAVKYIRQYLNEEIKKTNKSKQDILAQWYSDNKNLNTMVQKTPELASYEFPIGKERNETIHLIETEMAKRKLDKSDVDMLYWMDKITNVSENYGIPKEILVAIISKETQFQKNVSKNAGKGAMQQTLIAIKDFFPTFKQSWTELYKNIDEKLLNDILYDKNAAGNIKKDKNGKPILKFKTPESLLSACAKDDGLSIEVGALIFKMQYAKAAAEKKYGKINYGNVAKTIDSLKSGAMKPSQAMNYNIISEAVENYNGNSKYKMDYKKDVVDSLRIERYNFSSPIIKKDK